MQEAANRVISWLQDALRKPDSNEDDMDEDKFMDPCTFFTENYRDEAKRLELFTEMQEALDNLTAAAAGPVQTVGPPDCGLVGCELKIFLHPHVL